MEKLKSKLGGKNDKSFKQILWKNTVKTNKTELL